MFPISAISDWMVKVFRLSYLCYQQQLRKGREANVRTALEKRSLVPQMIYLSIQCASASLKENIEANGSMYDPKITSELRFLLERYAKILGFPFNDAIEVLIGVSSGQKSSEV